MDKIYQIFLNILKTAMQGGQFTSDSDISQEEWNSILSLAQSHNVLPLVYQATYKNPQVKSSAVAGRVRQLVMMQTVKTSEFLQVYKRLVQSGCTPLVVKGYICRSLYPQPDLRLSTDEDILIPPQQYGICKRVLEEEGMYTEMTTGEAENAHEVPFRQKDGVLYIELHKSLFPPESEAYGSWNRFFEKAEQMAVESNGVYTLGHTDHMFYLICHAIKHFFHSGFGIRQLCDITMYANACGSMVDWDKVYKNCCKINAQTFVASLFVASEKYLAFSREKSCIPQYFMDEAVDETNMLTDLLSAGVFGGATMSRKHSSNMTLDAVSADKQGKKAKKSLKNTLFPSAQKLKGRYPYLEQQPYLLPMAWADRVINYIRETRSAQNNAALETLQIGGERIALLREYKFIK